MTNDSSAERTVISEMLATRRRFLRQTVQNLTGEQAASKPTVSELSLGGIVKHVTDVEQTWARFIVEGPSVMGDFDATAAEAHAATFRFEATDSLAGLLADYERVAAATEQLLWDLESLEITQPLPAAPWFPPGGTRSAREVFLHIVAETAHHSGHADIIRESIDGAKTMG